jgi:hypothetical protein
MIALPHACRDISTKHALARTDRVKGANHRVASGSAGMTDVSAGRTQVIASTQGGFLDLAVPAGHEGAEDSQGHRRFAHVQ